MPTTPQGIYYPDATTNVSPLQTVFSTMASSIDDILAGDAQIHKVANTSERAALVAQFPPSTANPLIVWRANATAGQRLEYSTNGTTWHYILSSEDTLTASVPMAAGFTGAVTATKANTLVEIVISASGTFPTGNTTLVAVSQVPSAFRPPAARVGAVSMNGVAGATAVVQSGGNIIIRNDTGASRTGAQGSIIYFN